jgi:chromosome segregation ATPase
VTSDDETIEEAAERLKRETNQLRDHAQHLETDRPDRNAMYELEDTIRQREARIHALEGELETVTADATSLQRDLDVKILQIASFEKTNNQLSEDYADMQNKHLAEVAQFEGIIDERNVEVRDLDVQLRQARADLTEQTVVCARHMSS